MSLHEIRVVVDLPDDAPQMVRDTVLNAAALGAANVPLPGGSPRLIGDYSIKPLVPEVGP